MESKGKGMRQHKILKTCKYKYLDNEISTVCRLSLPTYNAIYYTLRQKNSKSLIISLSISQDKYNQSTIIIIKSDNNPIFCIPGTWHSIKINEFFESLSGFS